MIKIKSIMKPLVLMSDFGLKEHFVACMKGVAISVNPDLKIFDLTHHIEPFNIWDASITLADTIAFWPKGTVFVSVVDPGVGTDRKAVVVKTNTGKYIVSPDNGVFTFVEEYTGIESIRLIDEIVNRRPGSGDIHTFHGRDIYVYTGAKLAAGIISYEEVGPSIQNNIVKIKYRRPEKKENNNITGTILKIEEPYGNLVTNIPRLMLEEIYNDKSISHVAAEIYCNEESRFNNTIPFVKSFGFVKHNFPLAYIDSSGRLGLAVNQGNFARTYNIKAGKSSIITISIK